MYSLPSKQPAARRPQRGAHPTLVANLPDRFPGARMVVGDGTEELMELLRTVARAGGHELPHNLKEVHVQPSKTTPEQGEMVRQMILSVIDSMMEVTPTVTVTLDLAPIRALVANLSIQPSGV